MPEPKKNTAFTFSMSLGDSANRPQFKANPTLATGDFKVSIDGGAFNNLATLPTVAPASGRNVEVALSSSEMNGDRIVVQAVDAAGGEWDEAMVAILTTTNTVDDVYSRIGAPAGASVSADVAAVKAETASIQSDTNDIQTRLPAALVSGRIDASVGAVAANAITAAAIATDAIDGDAIAASAVTEIQSGLATAAALATVQADTDDIQTRLPAALVGGRIDASVGAMAAGTVTAAAVATGAIDADALAADAVAEIWDEQVDGTVTARQSLRLANSANGGKVAGAATTTVTIRDLADTKARVTATVDADGNRTAVTRDLT